MTQTSTGSARAHKFSIIDDAGSVPSANTEKTRFGAYFPRVFACAYSLMGDEAAAKDVAAEAFTKVLAHSWDRNEEEFVVELFGTTRDVIRATGAFDSTSANLTGRERELLAFMFDARLTHEEVRRLMQITEQVLCATLVAALRKVRSDLKPTAGNALRPA